jgi:hypothetical protein
VTLLLASCAVAACGASGGSEADGDPTRTGPAASAASSAATTSGPLTLAELARHPCRAIDDEDAHPSRLWVFTEPTETNYDAKSCQWGARGGLVSFTPYASTDETKAEKFQHLSRKNISGYRALLGINTDHGRDTYVLLVSVGGNQSFRLTVIPPVEDAPGPDAPTLATRFAKAILSHLQ